MSIQIWSPMASKRQFPFPEHLHPLTGVRFFLAIGVVIFHYQLLWAYPIEMAGLFNRARLSVDIFFILSGFILTHVYLLGDKVPDARSFIVARFARIYPAHFVILMGMLTMFFGAGLIGVALDSQHFNLAGFLRTFFLVQSWFPSHTLTNWNGPSWSLSAEWFVYLIFPLFAWLALKLREQPWTIVGLAVASFVLIDYFYVGATGIVLPDAEDNLGILRIMPEFLLGIGLYYVGQTLNPSKAQAVGFAITCTIALLGAMQFDFDDRVIVAIAGPFIVSLAFLSKANVTTFLSRPALLFWGEASFALYLVHMPAIMIWRNIVSKLYGLPHEYKMAWPELACLLAVTLALAAALHIWIERPGRFVIRAALMKPKTRKIASS
jgi:peptidoglycan/LPS O-acetylase OafA/YrhL